MSKYLKEESYYNDRYDLSTVQECLRIVECWQKAFKERFNSKELMDLSEQEKKRHFSSALNMNLYIVKGENYRRKSSTGIFLPN